MLKHFNILKDLLDVLNTPRTGRTGTRPILTISRITKKQCPSWPTGQEVMTTSSCWVRGYNSTPSPIVQSTTVNRTVERDGAVSGY